MLRCKVVFFSILFIVFFKELVVISSQELNIEFEKYKTDFFDQGYLRNNSMSNHTSEEYFTTNFISDEDMRGGIFPDWGDKMQVVEGKNFDAAVFRDTLAIIAACYKELDQSGHVLFTDESVTDHGQSIYDFGPAISLDENGIIHVITRGEGNKKDGFELLYHAKRLGEETWLHKNVSIGAKVPRNYAVDICPLSNHLGAVFAHLHKNTDNVWSTVHFYKIMDGVVDSLGAFGNSDLIRSDADFRMEVFRDTLHILTGKPDPNGKVYYMHAPVDGNLPDNLVSSKIRYNAGASRKGQPDIKIDTSGTIHFVYGALFRTYYNQISEGQEVIKNKPVFQGLNEWHLNFGLSAVSVSPDGKKILMVALKTNDSKTADNCDLLWTFSPDSGNRWTFQQPLGVKTHGGEGRMRPRIINCGKQFYLFYFDINSANICMKKVTPGNPDIGYSAPARFNPSNSIHTDTVFAEIILEEGAQAFYTLDGTVPSIISKKYEEPLVLTKNTTINALYCMPGMFPVTSTITYEIDIVINLAEVLYKKNGVYCFPNPLNNILYLALNDSYQGPVYIEFFNINGKSCLNKVLYKSNNNEIMNINTEKLDRGIFYIRIGYGDKKQNITLQKM